MDWKTPLVVIVSMALVIGALVAVTSLADKSEFGGLDPNDHHKVGKLDNGIPVRAASPNGYGNFTKNVSVDVELRDGLDENLTVLYVQKMYSPEFEDYIFEMEISVHEDVEKCYGLQFVKEVRWENGEVDSINPPRVFYVQDKDIVEVPGAVNFAHNATELEHADIYVTLLTTKDECSKTGSQT